MTGGSAKDLDYSDRNGEGSPDCDQNPDAPIATVCLNTTTERHLFVQSRLCYNV